MSRMKLLRLMNLMQRKKCLGNGGGDGDEITRDVRIGKWSDGETIEWVIVGDKVESFVVMTRSSVRPAWWVRKLTCWVRFALLRKKRNCCKCRSYWLPVCMLKSPVMRKIMWCCCTSWDEILKVDEKIKKRNRIMYKSLYLIVIAIDIKGSEFRF